MSSVVLHGTGTWTYIKKKDDGNLKALRKIFGAMNYNYQ